MSKSTSFYGVEGDFDLEFNWFPIDSDALTKLPLLPSFLQNSLNNLPASAEHLIWRD